MNPAWIIAGIAVVTMAVNGVVTWATIRTTVNGHTKRLDENDTKVDALVVDVAVLKDNVADLKSASKRGGE